MERAIALSSSEVLPVAPFKLWWRRFWIKTLHWEYWPMQVFNLPLVFIWIYQGIRARDLFFFARTNPGIPTGGFFGEPKSEILKHLPSSCKPTTILVKKEMSSEEARQIMEQHQLIFPVILKPEIGERGWLISKIDDRVQLEEYRNQHPIDFLMQTYVDLPVEASIMVYTMPDGSRSEVTSVCEKYFLQITGDGKSSFGQLIEAQDRAILHLEKLWRLYQSRWDEILPFGEVVILEKIGNHCRGTMFLNKNHLISPAMTKVMATLLATMPGVWYGRFDMRITSWDDLSKGLGIKVLEFNGTSSDPAHIYQPGYSLFKAYRDIARHWSVMRQIADQNRQLGISSVGLSTIFSALMLYFRYKRTN